MDLFLNRLLCGFRKAHSTQHALFKLLHSWQKGVNNSAFIGTILIDLSKAHDCLPHDLITAKFAICKKCLKLFLDYLEGRKQRVKIGSSYSFWSDVKRNVTQGSMLGPLLFNVFNNYLFMFIENCEICNFADDNTLYSGGMELSSILENLNHDTKILKWFRINSLKANPGEFQFMILLFFFFYQGFLSRTLPTQRTAREGRGPFLFHSTTSTRSRTFRHLCATLHVRRLLHIFNRNACIYQTATRRDLPPCRITI